MCVFSAAWHRAVWAGLVAGILAPAAIATPILYTFSGHAAGHLGTDTYSGNFLLELLSDTDKVLGYGPPSDYLFVIAPPGGAGYARITIDGVGVVKITEAVQIVLIPHNAETCLCIVVGAARNFASPQVFGLGNVAGLDQYDLQGNFGPVATDPPDSFVPGAYLATDHGNLDFIGPWGREDVLFSATLVPLPGAGWLMATAGITAALRVRRRTVRT